MLEAIKTKSYEGTDRAEDLIFIARVHFFNVIDSGFEAFYADVHEEKCALLSLKVLGSDTTFSRKTDILDHDPYYCWRLCPIENQYAHSCYHCGSPHTL